MTTDTKHDVGGQAYPHGDETHGGCDGMTLEDWFAGQALAGILAECSSETSHGVYAREAYRFAAAMIAEKRRREVPDPDRGKSAPGVLAGQIVTGRAKP